MYVCMYVYSNVHTDVGNLMHIVHVTYVHTKVHTYNNNVCHCNSTMYTDVRIILLYVHVEQYIFTQHS